MRLTALSAFALAAMTLLAIACGRQEPAAPTAMVAPAEPASAAAAAPAEPPAQTPPASVAVDLSAETAAYKAWVETQIDALLADTQKFADALKAGNVGEAKRLYAPARMYYERSEPIAESFGDLDPRIDNREADLQQNEKWTGFHTIEKILWTKNTTKGTSGLADQLINDIKELRAKLPTAEVTGELMVQGAVDLLNEVSTTKITGEEEIFSHTDLYDFKANIEGAEKIFEIFTPKIQAKDPKLVADLGEKFKAVNDLLAKYKTAEGYQSYTKLTKDDTKALAEAVNKLGEPLAQMGVVLQ